MIRIGWKKIALLALALGTTAVNAVAAPEVLKIHLYSPWKDDVVRSGPTAYIEVSGSGGPLPYRGMTMTSEGGDWFVATTPVAANNPTDGYMTFLFANYVPNASDAWANRDIYQNGNNQFRLDSVFFSPKFTEVWIYPQGAGKPPLIRDFAPPKKVVLFFNPWSLGAPAIKVGAAATYKKMRLPAATDNRCGWYLYYFSDDYSATATTLPVSFNNIIGGETYGAAGLGDTKTIDLQTLFATHDTLFVVPTPIPNGPAKLLTDFPKGVLGTCQFPLAVTIRDFSKNNPDFQHAGSFPDKVTKGMVLPTLDAENKPEKSLTPYLQSDFRNWFRDDSLNANPALRNYKSCYDLPISKDPGGYWSYSSIQSPSGSFFPIDDKNRFNETFKNCVDKDYIGGGCNFGLGDNKDHNFHFCMEMQADFTYNKGQEFSFVGDDDVWVFINKKLVIDLGGTHSPARDSVKLDNLGLVEGSRNDFRLFYCERQANGSNLYIKTSIYFEQKQNVFHQAVAGQSNEWDIYERNSGDKSCSGNDGDTSKPVLATSLFTLSGPSVNPAVALNAGISYGGITINATKTRVLADTAKMVGLAPGVYTVNYTSVASGKGGFIQFTIINTQTVDFASKPVVNVVKGTAVPVTIEAILKGVADKRAEVFVLFPLAGLVVFEDSALTKPIPAGTILTTLAATGNKNVWVTSQVPGVYSIEVKDGTSRGASQDLYTGITFSDRPKVEKPSATPASQDFSSLSPGLNLSLNVITPGATILYTLDGTNPDSLAGGSTKAYSAGTLIPITATTTLKAIAIKTGWSQSDLLTETYSRIIPPTTAAPVASPPSRTFTGPLPVSLNSITVGAVLFYTTDGSEPATQVSVTTKKYEGPLVFTTTTVLKAIAFKEGQIPSPILTETYTFLPPVSVNKAWYLDKDGDGKIETVVIEYSKDLLELPAKLSFKLIGEGKPEEIRTAELAKAEIAFSGNSHSRLTINLSNPFPFGLTAFTNGATSGQQFLQESIPMLDAFFAIEDSVPPVITTAEVLAADSAMPFVRVHVGFSEIVNLSLASKTALVFKREGIEMGFDRLMIDGISILSSQQYLFRVDENSTLFPIVGDSVAIHTNGEVKDIAGNIPTSKLFRRLEGVIPKPKPTKVYVTFANGAMAPGAGSRGNESAVPADIFFIPFDRNAVPLQGERQDGKCSACYVGQDRNFIGPVIYLEIPGPSEYEFKIFSTLGEFVAEGKGKISERDLASLAPIQSGTRYLVRIVWTGRAMGGLKAGTGSYVLASRIKTEKDLKTGAPPAIDVNRIVFGMLRNFHGN